MDYVAVTTIVVYLVVVTGVGVALARRSTSASQWTVAGGGMGMMMVVVGVAGTRIGGGGTYGVAGNVMAKGVWNLWWYGISTFLAMALVGLLFVLPYRRLRLQTVGEIFAMRFNSKRCQVLTSLCVQTEYFIVNVLEVYVIGVILIGVTDMPMWLAVMIASVVLVSYISLGGLWGSAATNLIHCTVILVGLGAVGYMGIGHLGGWEAMTEQINVQLAKAGKDQAAWWNFMGTSMFAVFAMVFSAVIHTPAASIYTNYATSAKNERLLIPAFLLAGLLGSLMPVLAGLIGMETLAKYGIEGVGGSYKNITILATEIHRGVGALALAAILAAVISSGGPILLSSATMFVRDWLPFTKNYSDEKKLKAYRITTVVYGVISAILAYIWYVSDPPITILDILLFGFAVVVPPAIAVGYLIYWKRTTEPGAYWGMLAGYATGMVWYGLIRWAVYVDFAAPEGSSAARKAFHACFIDFWNSGEGLDPSYLTTLIPLLAVPIISLFTSEETENREKFYDVLAGRGTYSEAEGGA